MSDKKFSSESSNFGSSDDPKTTVNTNLTSAETSSGIVEPAQSPSTPPLEQEPAPMISFVPPSSDVTPAPGINPLYQSPINPGPSQESLDDEALARRLQEEFDREIQDITTGEPFVLRITPLPPFVTFAQPILGPPVGPSGPAPAPALAPGTSVRVPYTLLDYLQMLPPQRSDSYPNFPGHEDEEPGEEEDETDPYNDVEDEDGTREDDDMEEEEEEEEESPQRNPLVNIFLQMLQQNNSPNSVNLARIMAGEASYEELQRLSELIPPVSRGANAESIQALPQIRFQASTELLTPGGVMIPGSRIDPSVALSPGTLSREKCIICLSEYENGDELIELPHCHHQFHKECVTEWLRINKICPICRVEIPTKSSPP
jgi:hypothetical protein